jgi:hypothetical protein
MSLHESDALPKEKFLLCRPQGGLNDTLCQIELCWRYAARFNRTLIIDARKSGLHADFSEFFQQKKASNKILLDVSSEMFDFLNRLECFPGEIRGKIHDLDLVTWLTPNWVMKNTAVRLTFDFSKDYDQALLVHEQCGGGSSSFYLLEKLTIATKTLPIVLDRVRQFDGNYYAVHVRNTDLKTEYKAFFTALLPIVKNKRLLVCSDDLEVIQYARKFFSSSEILVSSDIPATNGGALHQNNTDYRTKNAIDAIVDLIALGKSEKLFFSNVTAGYTSGFSTLAAHLSRNKYVVDGLLGIPRTHLIPTSWRLKYLRRVYVREPTLRIMRRLTFQMVRWKSAVIG